MTTDGTTANACVEATIDQRARVIERMLDYDVLAFVGPLLYDTDGMVRCAVESRRSRRTGLVVVLETTGGYIEPVRRIVSVLRRHYSHVEFVVPSQAMSAGTILVMSGDVIHMDYYAVLGPIDPQVERNGKPVPALGYLVQYERLLAKAQQGNASSAELAILVRFDQAELYSFEQAREDSIELLREWLATYKFKDWVTTETQGTPVTEKIRMDRASEVAQVLNDTDRWHTHGRGITMDVLKRDLKLRIDDFGANPKLAHAIRRYHGLLVDYLRRTGRELAVHRCGQFVF